MVEKIKPKFRKEKIEKPNKRYTYKTLNILDHIEVLKSRYMNYTIVNISYTFYIFCMCDCKDGTNFC
jgi:hypothetical protein